MPILLVTALLLPQAAGAGEFCFDEAGREFMLSPQLLKSIASVESGMNPAARNLNRNGSIDLGLMQVNSSWIGRAGFDRERLLSDPCYNTRAGARILRGCIDRYGYSWQAVGCYNAASAHKRKSYAWKVFRRLAADAKRPPVNEPRDVVGAVRQIEGRSLTISFEEQSEPRGFAAEAGHE